MAKRYWLMKTEPDTFSIDDLERVGTEPWTGVRNFTARNFMRDQMQVGDTVLFYHSSCAVPGVYGEAKVSSPSYPDPTQFDAKSEYYDKRASTEKPLWFLVDVEFVRKLDVPYTLAQMRANKELVEMVTLEPGSRLSVTPVTPEEAREILG
ncbi:MAG: EVE domain-containing protein [Candidatus Pacebacteria bacterium]|nr:EVE domain-containing protein [Candidatus Paceibacterota bacterium]MBP9840387.1 EVE domain-containing protein [Candidatus Paceibacterota bacterium]